MLFIAGVSVASRPPGRAAAHGREPVSVNGSFTASKVGRRLCGNEPSKATGSSRPFCDIRCSELDALQRTLNVGVQPPPKAVGWNAVGWTG